VCIYTLEKAVNPVSRFFAVFSGMTG